MKRIWNYWAGDVARWCDACLPRTRPWAQQLVQKEWGIIEILI